MIVRVQDSGRNTPDDIERIFVRGRDTMEQERVPLDAVVDHVLTRLAL